MFKENKFSVIELASGIGSRMNSRIPKQFLELSGEKVIFYSLDVFEKSPADDIIITADDRYRDLILDDVIKKHDFKKCEKIVRGGSERYLSVLEGIKQIADKDSYVIIHDSARPLVNKKMLIKAMSMVIEKKAVVCAVPSKDTVKITDGNGKIISTTDRKRTMIVQTPQLFYLPYLLEAYENMYASGDNFVPTDDSSIVENYTEYPVYISAGSYNNVKLTTADDMTYIENEINLQKDIK